MTASEKTLACGLCAAVAFFAIGAVLEKSLGHQERSVPGWIKPEEMRPSKDEMVVALYAVDAALVPERVVYQSYVMPDGGYVEYWIRYTDGSAQPDLGRPVLWKGIPHYPDRYIKAISKRR